jgi:hypothetical protein
MFDKSIPRLESRNAIFGGVGLGGHATDITLPDFRDKISRVVNMEGADSFDPREALCPRGQCISSVDGVSIYKDSEHIAASQIGILGNTLLREFEQ